MLNNQMVYPLQQFHAVTYEDKSSRKFPARRVQPTHGHAEVAGAGCDFASLAISKHFHS